MHPSSDPGGQRLAGRLTPGEPRILRLVGEPRDVHVARAFARQVLAARGVDDRDDDAIFVVSELVTNAIVHGEAPITLTVDVQMDAVVVSVCDAGSGHPIPRSAGERDENGRGLGIVDGFSERWYVEHAEGSKTTTARVPLRYM